MSQSWYNVKVNPFTGEKSVSTYPRGGGLFDYDWPENYKSPLKGYTTLTKLSSDEVDAEPTSATWTILNSTYYPSWTNPPTSKVDMSANSHLGNYICLNAYLAIMADITTGVMNGAYLRVAMGRETNCRPFFYSDNTFLANFRTDSTAASVFPSDLSQSTIWIENSAVYESGDLIKSVKLTYGYTSSTSSSDANGFEFVFKAEDKLAPHTEMTKLTPEPTAAYSWFNAISFPFEVRRQTSDGGDGGVIQPIWTGTKVLTHTISKPIQSLIDSMASDAEKRAIASVASRFIRR